MRDEPPYLPPSAWARAARQLRLAAFQAKRHGMVSAAEELRQIAGWLEDIREPEKPDA